MTADQVKGRGFRGALSYNLEKLEKGEARLLDMSFAVLKEQAIMKEIALVKMLKPNLQKYFYHTSLNFPPEEDLPDEKIKEIALEYLQGMGFKDNQYLIFRHFDADHPHLHILVNRIGYDGSVVSDSNDYRRSESVLRALEVSHGLRQVPGSRQVLERAMTKDELEMMNRTNHPSAKMMMQVILKDALNSRGSDGQPLSTEEFVRQLEQKGMNVLFNQASTGYVSGISYEYQGMKMKGAQLGQAYKWQAVRSTISYEQERDRTAVCQANNRARAAAGTGSESDGITAAGITAGRDHQIVPGGTVDAHGAAGILRLEDEAAGIGSTKEDGRNKPAVVGNGDTGQSHSGAPRKDQQTSEQDRQQVAHQAVPPLHCNGDLLGAGNAAGDLDQEALKKFEKKKRKRRKLRL